VLAPPDLTDSIRKVHDFLTVGAASPLQQAGVMALGMPDEYYTGLAAEYAGKRDHILASLEGAGLACSIPHGAYYVMADISRSGFRDDVTFVRNLIENIGIAAVPGSSFFLHPADGASFVRFCFCKKYETLETARQKLKRLNG
jgi:aspartate/methionine/tyrosine aminotransferase